MGSRDRLSYTCIGDSVTLAARLEGLTRIYGVRNCVGPMTVEHCPKHLMAVALDLIAVKGFARAVEVYTVLPRSTPGLQDFSDALAAARMAYVAKDWAAAEAAFSRVARIKVPFCNTGSAGAAVSGPHHRTQRKSPTHRMGRGICCINEALEPECSAIYALRPAFVVEEFFRNEFE